MNKFMDPLQKMMLRLAERLDEVHWLYTQQLNKGGRTFVGAGKQDD